MSWFKKFQSQTLNVPGLGELKNAPGGWWSLLEPIDLHGNKVQIGFGPTKTPPGQAEASFLIELTHRWPEIWTNILNALKEDFKDDPTSEKEVYFQIVAPDYIIFSDFSQPQKEWEVTLTPEIYEGHIVTVWFKNFERAGVRLDG